MSSHYHVTNLCCDVCCLLRTATNIQTWYFIPYWLTSITVSITRTELITTNGNKSFTRSQALHQVQDLMKITITRPSICPSHHNTTTTTTTTTNTCSISLQPTQYQVSATATASRSTITARELRASRAKQVASTGEHLPPQGGAYHKNPSTKDELRPQASKHKR